DTEYLACHRVLNQVRCRGVEKDGNLPFLDVRVKASEETSAAASWCNIGIRGTPRKVQKSPSRGGGLGPCVRDPHAVQPGRIVDRQSRPRFANIHRGRPPRCGVEEV